jgi:hypothetical protein
MQSALDAARQALSLVGAPNVNTLALIVVALTGFENATIHPWARSSGTRGTLLGQFGQGCRNVHGIRP